MNYQTATPELVSAVAEVIESAGWTAMAAEFRAEPAKRERIVTAMTRNISRDSKPQGAKFAELVRWYRF